MQTSATTWGANTDQQQKDHTFTLAYSDGIFLIAYISNEQNQAKSSIRVERWSDYGRMDSHQSETSHSKAQRTSQDTAPAK